MTIFTIVFAYIVAEASAPNVLLGKRGSMCQPGDLRRELFDGLYHVFASVDPVHCSRASMHLALEMAGLYYVHYIVVFPAKTNSSSPLDFAVVSLINDLHGDAPNPVESLCSRVDNQLNSLDLNPTLRINCIVWEKLFTTVKIRIVNMTKIFVAEIEVHTLASGIQNESVSLYRGCFKNFVSLEEFPFFGLEDCKRRCIHNNHSIAAVERSKYCHCGRNYEYDQELPRAKCNQSCRGINASCGGLDTYSLFVVKVQLPVFLGCMATRSDFLNEYTYDDNRMTVAKCLRRCNYHKYGILKGIQCMCSMRVGVDYVPSTRCNFPCGGSSEDRCGGKNSLSVWTTCMQKEDIYLTCEKLLQCREGEYDKFGRCTKGCKTDYIEENCVHMETDFEVFSFGSLRSHRFSRLLPILHFMIALYKYIFPSNLNIN